MPASQTYEARAIRVGYHAHHGQCQGTVVSVYPKPTEGVVNLLVQCHTHGETEEWTNLPAHSAVHASPEVR